MHKHKPIITYDIHGNEEPPMPRSCAIAAHMVGVTFLTMGIVFVAVFFTFVFRADEYVGLVAFLGIFTSPVAYIMIYNAMRNEYDRQISLKEDET